MHDRRPCEPIDKALGHLNRSMSECGAACRRSRSTSSSRCCAATARAAVIRNIFQLFHDMIMAYVGEGVDEYPDDPESINYVYYDCRRLFVEDTDHPFFADRLFANRLMNLVEACKRGAQQNKIYIFEGPPGCGKSTFLEQSPDEVREVCQHRGGHALRGGLAPRPRKLMASIADARGQPVSGQAVARCSTSTNCEQRAGPGRRSAPLHADGDYIEIPCPSHDNPLLLIPKAAPPGLLRRLFEERRVQVAACSPKRSTSGSSRTTPAPSAARSTRRCSTG